MFKTKLLALAVSLCLFMVGCGDDGPTSPIIEETPENPTLSTVRTDWQLSSKPAQLDDNYVRGKLLWYSPRDLVAVEDIWDRDAAQGQGTVRTFRMIFRPRHIKTDTVIVNDLLVVDTIATGLKSWAGITSYLVYSSYHIHDTTQFFELRARGRRGRMHIEFGHISEDINGNGFAESEDGIITGAQNGQCEPEEDVGLDGLADPDESDFWEQIKDINPDPAGDNWYFDGVGKCPLPPDRCDQIDWDDESIHYEWLNGTEGNINDPSVQGKPDQESFARGLYTSNSYFSFVIDFESDSFRVPDSDWPPSANPERIWWTYRLPIRDTAAMDEIVDEYWPPRWSEIRYARIWFEDESVDNTIWDTVEVAQWGFLQTGVGPFEEIDPGPDSNITVVRDYEYARGRVFDLGYVGEFGPNDKIVNLIMYEEMRNPVDSVEADGIATFMVDPRNPNQYVSEGVKGIYVNEVPLDTYFWEDDPDRNLHYVVFNREKGRHHWLGAYMWVQKGDDTVVIGDLTYGVAGDSLALRILRHPNPIPEHQSWRLMWRNCYNIPRGMQLEDLNIKVFKGLPGSEFTHNIFDFQDVGGLRQSYLEIFGLDQYDVRGRKVPDGLIDERMETYRPDWGLLFFPEREPFNSSQTFTDELGNVTQPLQDTVQYIYINNLVGQQAVDASRYFIRLVTYPRSDCPN